MYRFLKHTSTCLPVLQGRLDLFFLFMMVLMVVNTAAFVMVAIRCVTAAATGRSAVATEGQGQGQGIPHTLQEGPLCSKRPGLHMHRTWG